MWTLKQVLGKKRVKHRGTWNIPVSSNMKLSHKIPNIWSQAASDGFPEVVTRTRGNALISRVLSTACSTKGPAGQNRYMGIVGE